MPAARALRVLTAWSEVSSSIFSPARSGSLWIIRASSRPSMRGSTRSSRATVKGSPDACASRRAASASAGVATATGRRCQAASCSVRMNRLVSLSSTTSTRSSRSGWGRVAAGRGATEVCSSRAVKEKVLPRPGWLSTWMRPCIASTSCWEMARPSPVPPCRRVVDRSAWVKASKSPAWASGAMPAPVSVTSTCSSTPSPSLRSTRARIATSPCSVNFTALEPRLVRTWPRRVGSPRRNSGTSGWQETTSSRSFSWAGPLSTAAVCSKTLRTSKSTSSSSSLPDSIFDRSRMSLMIASSDSPALCTPAASRCWWSSSSVRSSSSLRPMTPFMGVRISWLIVARNSDFSREASIAASRAARTSAASRSRVATTPSWSATCAASRWCSSPTQGPVSACSTATTRSPASTGRQTRRRAAAPGASYGAGAGPSLMLAVRRACSARSSSGGQAGGIGRSRRRSGSASASAR